ncbi:efflux RND transporter permease subunit [Candidatus Gracilibacteria bacterium]|nr:efflux RND transporter permease subunit [Candidatus Gracilibacteria bacterium]MCF7856657.1 efflux RND transporter permease subunit [Candidatus Gracilibacteria bacterium]MCF7896974.1 efflux RND transporter permease subunit [Candidatus Gracilibacteria bacterium]
MHAADEKGISKVKDSFWGFFVNNWRVTILLLILFVLGGVFSLFTLPLESDPEVEIPIAIVSTTYPGASPADIEKLITDRIEERLKNLNNLDKLTSSSSEGVSSITVEFDASADLTESIRDLRDEIENIKKDLPENANDPIVTEISVSDQAIISASLLSRLPPSEMKKYGEDLQDILEGIPGASEVILSGLQGEEVQVLVDIRKLEGYEISISEVVNSISRNHTDFPIGSILTNGFYYTASLKAQFSSAEELLELPVISRGNQNIYLRDIAEVRQAFAEKTSEARVFKIGENNLLDSVTLQVKKKTGANIVELADAVKSEVEKYKNEVLPPSVEILISNDWSEYVRDDIRTLGRSALQTIAIIFIVLFLALGRKEALMVGFSIPLIFLLAFTGLSLVGETLNGIVLFSLILSLGLIVDTSIVIMEGVYEGVKERGLNGREAALLAIHTYKAPLIAGTLTTVSVFIPMMLMSGIMGEFIKHIPITINLTLFSSLFIAIFILSAVAARVFQDYHKTEKKDKKPVLEKFITPLRAWYLRKIREILYSKRKRRGFVVGMLVAMVLTFALPVLGILKVQMFPSVNLDFFMVNVELPVGATLEETSRITSEVEGLIPDLPEVINYVSIIGGGGASFAMRGGGLASTNKAQITVNLTKMDARKIKSYQIAELMREKIKPITEAKVEVEELNAGPPSGAPVEIRVKGEEVGQLEMVAELLVRELEKIPGTRDVASDVEHGTGEFHFKLKRDRLNFYGVSAVAVAADLRTAVFGNDSVKILRSGEETPIVVVLDFRAEDCKSDKFTQILEKRDSITLCRNSPSDISQIRNLLISTPKGMIPVSELADVELHPAITVIRHNDTEIVVNVHAYTEEGTLPVDVVEKIQTDLPNFSDQIPAGVRLEFGGETEDITESFMSLFRAMIIGVFLIVLILVLQFNSFRQPFIIMFTLPLALIGVFGGLALIGKNLSFPGFIGVVALAGVVVNDAIVLIDRINHNIKAGIPKLEAIIQSGGERLQPIILTTVTTAFGVLPLAFANELWGDLAWSIAFGITFATILTLVMVPILYNWLESDKELGEVEHEENSH